MFNQHSRDKKNRLNRAFSIFRGKAHPHFSILPLCIIFIYLCAGCDIAPVIPDNQAHPAFGVFADEDLYSHVASYCYDLTGYGGDSCLDWTEYILENYQDAVSACFDPYANEGLLSDAQYDSIGACLQLASVPDP